MGQRQKESLAPGLERGFPFGLVSIAVDVTRVSPRETLFDL